MAPSQSKLSHDIARRMLRQAGLRVTASRVAVLRDLALLDAPLSHAEISERLEPSGFGAPTVFRCLVDLAEAGLATRLDLGDHVWPFGFHAEVGQPAEEQPHFLCIDCGKATCLPGLKIRVSGVAGKAANDFGEVTEVVLKGRCASCR
jgi:Fur family ferric uptake transcriptional regulator